MRILFALTLLLASANSFAASSTCLVSYESNSTCDSKNCYGQIFLSCEKGNADGKIIQTADTTVTTTEIATAINSLLNKGYMLISQSNNIWTLVK